MSFISYAQNYEDVILWRALKHIENGFYIDVGANDPDVDSVTKAFYERGWRGVNIEPLTLHHQDLIGARKRDINLLAAAGEKNGQIEIWECNVRGWATASEEVIAQYESDGLVGTIHKVPVYPLKDICAKYVENDIHFLKIDVEGFEAEVVRGMDFIKYRPWIVVVEATKPNSTDEVHQKWETDLIKQNYIFAYADGLNRFYLASEHDELLGAMRYPPNVFDRFIRSQEYELDLALRNSESKLHEVDGKLAKVEIELKQAEAEVDKYAAMQLALYNSKSWQLTSPLRWFMAQWRLLRQHGLIARIEAIAKKIG